MKKKFIDVSNYIQNIDGCVRVYEYYFDKYENQYWCWFYPKDLGTMERIRKSIQAENKTLVRREYKDKDGNNIYIEEVI